MAWVYLLIAAACEMVWPIGFKYTNGFREHYGVVAITFGIMGLSLWLVSVAIHHGMHVGSAYAVWTGLGAAGTAVLGMVLYHEPRVTAVVPYAVCTVSWWASSSASRS